MLEGIVYIAMFLIEQSSKLFADSIQMEDIFRTVDKNLNDVPKRSMSNNKLR